MGLRLESVTREVGGEVHLHPLDLTLEPGRIHVLLGPTLAGKTTLLRIMAGLVRPSSGRLLENGRDVTGVPVRRRDVAMVYQEFINYPNLSAYENIASPLRVRGLSRSEIDARVREAARMLRILPFLERLPGELSGGQQQRLAIARALVKQAQLLLLDEPLVNLDYKLREELRVELRGLFRRDETCVVYATTEPLEALLMGGEVAVLDEGRLLQTGPAREVYRHPASVRVARIFSDPPMNLLPVRIREGTAETDEGLRLPLGRTLAQLPPGPYTLGLRATQLAMAPASPRDIAVPGEVLLAEVSGSETFLHIRLQGAEWVVQLEGVHHYRLGQRLTVHFDPEALYAFDGEGALAAAPQAVTARSLERA